MLCLMSHPVWVRGLKPLRCVPQNVFAMSHPVWVRGLKQHFRKKSTQNVRVAPRVGAWIETSDDLKLSDDDLVAPRVGAWIETLIYLQTKYYKIVAPRVGAWIETVVVRVC